MKLDGTELHYTQVVIMGNPYKVALKLIITNQYTIILLAEAIRDRKTRPGSWLPQMGSPEQCRNREDETKLGLFVLPLRVLTPRELHQSACFRPTPTIHHTD